MLRNSFATILVALVACGSLVWFSFATSHQSSRLIIQQRPAPLPDSKTAAVPPQVEASIYFLGDAGDIDPRAAQLLKAVLSSQLSVPRLVIFMGDNIYPAGLPPEGTPQYRNEYLKLKRQLDIIRQTGARALFVPGNHDWKDYKRSGYSESNVQSILDMGKAITTFLKDTEAFLPANGCPGPARLVFAGSSVLALDTQWLLFEQKEKKLSPASCAVENEAVYRELATEVSSSTAPIDIMVSHHPLISYGRHGKESGLNCGQGLLCPGYLRMEHSIHRAIAAAPPGICAGGHDHSLQIIKNRDPERCRYYLVSGAMSNTTPVHHGEGLLYGASRLGFMRLDFVAENLPRLQVFTVQSGAEVPEYYLDLDLTPTAVPPA